MGFLIVFLLSMLALRADPDPNSDRLMPILKGPRSNSARELHRQSEDDGAVRSGPWNLTGSGDRPVTLVNFQDDIGGMEIRLSAEPGRSEELIKARERLISSLDVADY